LILRRRQQPARAQRHESEVGKLREGMELLLTVGAVETETFILRRA